MNTYIKLYSLWVALAAVIGAAYFLGENLRSHKENDLIIPKNIDKIMIENYECITNSDCNNGKCVRETNVFGKDNNTTKCECNSGYITVDDSDICGYKQLSGLTALLLAIFVGGCGVNWCFLARGSGAYICIGILKGCTCGGIGIWVIIDIVLIAIASLPDGNGEKLTEIA